MADLTLYHCPRTRAFHALWALEETGVDYDVKLVNVRDEIQSEAYQGINPMRKVPAIAAGETLITESPAIAAWLAETYPDAGLAPPLGTPERGDYLRWLFFCGACIEPAFIDKAFSRETPRATCGWGSAESVIETLEEGLKNRNYLAGDRFSMADLMIGSTLNFMMNFNLLERREPFTTYVGGLVERPAFVRATEKDQAWAAEVFGE